MRTPLTPSAPRRTPEFPSLSHGEGAAETKDGIASMANLYLGDYGELIGRLAPVEDVSQGLGNLLG